MPISRETELSKKCLPQPQKGGYGMKLSCLLADAPPMQKRLLVYIFFFFLKRPYKNIIYSFSLFFSSIVKYPGKPRACKFPLFQVLKLAVRKREKKAP